MARPYRSESGHELHTAILGFIRGNQTEQDVLYIFNKWKNDNDAFQETSINGHSHLIDIFHLSHKLEDDKKRRDRGTFELCYFLFYSLFDAINSSKVSENLKNSSKRFLLTQPDHHGYTPLHSVLELSPLNLHIYLEMVKKIFNDKIITKRELAKLLTCKANSKKTPLHIATDSRYHEVLREYLDTIMMAYQSMIITKEEYADLLTSQNEKDLTPRDLAMRSPDPFIAFIYFDTVETAYNQRVLTAQQYADLLLDLTVAELTPLQQILNFNEPCILRFYLCMVERAIKNGVIWTQEYTKLLSYKDLAGRTPLDQAIVSGNLELVKELVEHLLKATPKKIERNAFILDLLDRTSFSRDKGKLVSDSIHSYLLDLKISLNRNTHINLFKPMNNSNQRKRQAENDESLSTTKYQRVK